MKSLAPAIFAAFLPLASYRRLTHTKFPILRSRTTRVMEW